MTDKNARIVLTAEDRTRAALGSLKQHLGQVSELASAAGFSLAALGSSLTLGGLTIMAKKIVDGIDAMNDLKDATGASIENISALESIARRTGGNFDTVSTSLIKLNQALGQTLKPGSEAEKVIKAIGLNAKQLRDLDPAEAFLKTAVALNRFADDGNKGVAVGLLFGKSLKEIAPLLKDVAEAGKLVATMTEEQAQEVEKFNKELFKMEASLLDAGRAMAGPVVAGFNGLIDYFKDARKEGELLVVTLVKLASPSALIKSALGVERDKRNGYAEARQGIDNINIALKDTSLRQGEINALLAQRARLQNQMAGYLNSTAGAGRGMGGYEGAPKGSITLATDDPEAKKKAAAAATALKKELEEQAKVLAELNGVSGDFAERWDRLNAMFRTGKINLEQLGKAQADLWAKQAAGKKQLEDIAAVEKERDKQQTEHAAGRRKQFLEEHDEAERQKKAASDALQSAKDDYEQHGLLKSQIAELTLARLRDRLVVAEAGSEAHASLVQQIADQEQLIGILRGGELRDANEKAAAEAASAWAQVGDAFVDNLMRGGKSVAQYLKDLFRTLVLRPMLAPTGQAVGGMMGGLPMAAGQAGGAGSLGSLGNAMGLAGSLGTFGAGMTAGFGGLTGSIGGLFGMAGTGATLGGALSAGTTALAAGNIMGGLGTIAGALGPIALGIGALVAIAGKRGETRSGGKYINGAFLEGPSGGEINGEASRQAIGATMGGINALLAQLGSSAALGTLESGFESSKNGKGFAYAGGTLSTGAAFGQTTGLGYLNRRGSMTPEQAAQAFGEELKQATLQALQAADVPGQLGDYLRQLGDIDQLSGGALDAALGRINKALTEKQQLEAKLFDLTATDLEKLTRARDAERAAIDTSNAALLEQVYALEDQRRASEQAAAATQSLQNAGKSLSDYLRTLTTGRAGTASPEAQLTAARENYLQDLRQAREGNLDAHDRIASSAQGYVDAQKDYTASGGDTQAVISQVISEMQALPAVQSYAQAQTTQPLASVVTDSLAAYTAAQAAAIDAKIAQLQAATQAASQAAMAPAVAAPIVQAVQEALSGSGYDPSGVNVPMFASGGDFAGGARIVGERGPELEVTGPSRIFSNSQSRALMDTSRLEAKLERLEATVRELLSRQLQQGGAVGSATIGLQQQLVDNTRDQAANVRLVKATT